MCRRDTTDPLLSVFAGRGYNLLRNARTGVVPGAVWIKFDRTFEPAGTLPDLIEGGFDLPKATDKQLLDVEQRRTDHVAASAGLNALAPALVAMGVPAVVDEIRAGVERQKGVRFVIGLTGIVETSVSLAKLAQNLPNNQVDAAIAKSLTKGRTVGIATTVVHSRGFSIDVVDEHGSAVNLGVDAAVVAGATAKLQHASVTATHLEFTGSKPIAFGVRLYEAIFDRNRRGLRIDRIHRHKVLDGDEKESKPEQEAEPLIVTGATGDLFTAL